MGNLGYTRKNDTMENYKKKKFFFVIIIIFLIAHSIYIPPIPLEEENEKLTIKNKHKKHNGHCRD